MSEGLTLLIQSPPLDKISVSSIHLPSLQPVSVRFILMLHNLFPQDLTKKLLALRGWGQTEVTHKRNFLGNEK